MNCTPFVRQYIILSTNGVQFGFHSLFRCILSIGSIYYANSTYIDSFGESSYNYNKLLVLIVSSI